MFPDVGVENAKATLLVSYESLREKAKSVKKGYSDRSGRVRIAGHVCGIESKHHYSCHEIVAFGSRLTGAFPY